MYCSDIDDVDGDGVRFDAFARVRPKMSIITVSRPGPALSPSPCVSPLPSICSSGRYRPLATCSNVFPRISATANEGMWDTPLFTPVEDDETAVDYLGESTFGDLALVERISTEGVLKALGVRSKDELMTLSHPDLKSRVGAMLHELGVATTYPGGSPHRGVYCSRTLNLRSIRAIGYDMDYTLLQYDVRAWEGSCYRHSLKWLSTQGVNTAGLEFDPDMVIRGLVVDKLLGNLVKVDRFGLVKRAMHGCAMMSPAEIHSVYGHECVNLRNEQRFEFLNTFFSVSEACIYMQLVQRLDSGELGDLSPQFSSYQGLAALVGKALYNAHVESQLKSEIIANPEKFVILDPEIAQTLLDQRAAGKKLVLITNSDFRYTDKLMSFAFDRFLPQDMTYRDLFEIVIMQSRKPSFFQDGSIPLYEIVTEDGLMRPVSGASPAARGDSLSPLASGSTAAPSESFSGPGASLDIPVAMQSRTAPGAPEAAGVSGQGEGVSEGKGLRRGRVFCGGSARIVEEYLGVRGDDILYVGDHIYSDNALAKPKKGTELRTVVVSLCSQMAMRWRTALIIRELEEEIEALARGRQHRQRLKELMNNKELLGDIFNQVRLYSQRTPSAAEDPRVNNTLAQLLLLMESFDAMIAPMLMADGENFNRKWGYLSRAGLNDKSQLARQIEKYADIYTSRVSNFLRYTPFNYFRSPTQSLAHDRNLTAYWKTREEGSASLESFLARPDSPSPSPDGDSDSTGGAAQGDGGRLVELPELASYKEAVELMARNMSREEEEKEGEKEREGEEEKEGDKESGRLGDKVKPSGSGKGKQKRGKKRV